MYKPKILAIILAVFIVGGIGLYFLNFRELDDEGDNLKPEIAVETGETAVAEVEPPARGSTSDASEPGKISGNRFVSDKYGFSFEVPEGFKAGTFRDEKGETVVVEVEPPAGGSTSKNLRQGFQVYISPFDTEGPLSAKFIRSEVPDMPMRNVRTAKLDSKPAIVFESENESIGQTFEVWLAHPESPVPHGNYLYQITAYKEFAGELTKILQTWKFQ